MKSEQIPVSQLSEEIELEGVTKQFPNEPQPAVDHVSLRVAAGSFVVLLGPSGCGKTTLLKMINRLYEPSEGVIRVGGEDVRSFPVTELRRQIGYVIQQVGLFPHMTIEENIAVVPRLLGWERGRRDARVEFLLEMVGLPQAYRKRYPRQLSGGEQQRVGLARALAVDPAILLMDEPFAAIDAINRVSLQEKLLEIQCQVHKTVLFVTHDVEEALRLADRIAILRAGKLLQYGTPLEIVTQSQDAFVGELVGSENILRRSSLIAVQAVLDARPAGAAEAHGPGPLIQIHPEDNLRTALSLLLSQGGEVLQVVDRQGRMVGTLSFADLRRALAQQGMAQAAAAEGNR